MRSLTSTLNAPYSAHHRPGPQRGQSQAGGCTSGCQWVVDLLKWLPKCIFPAEERYGAQVDMCHFGLAGSGNTNPSNFRSTLMAAATLRPPVRPLVVGLNECSTRNVPPWFTWCSIQVFRHQGTDTMGLHALLRHGAPMALILPAESLPQGQKVAHRFVQG